MATSSGLAQAADQDLFLGQHPGTTPQLNVGLAQAPLQTHLHHGEGGSYCEGERELWCLKLAAGKGFFCGGEGGGFGGAGVLV